MSSGDVKDGRNEKKKKKIQVGQISDLEHLRGGAEKRHLCGSCGTLRRFPDETISRMCCTYICSLGQAAEKHKDVNTAGESKKPEATVWSVTHHVLAVLVGNVLLQTLLTAE